MRISSENQLFLAKKFAELTSIIPILHNHGSPPTLALKPVHVRAIASRTRIYPVHLGCCNDPRGILNQRVRSSSLRRPTKTLLLRRRSSRPLVSPCSKNWLLSLLSSEIIE